MKIRFLGAHNAESKNTKLASFLIDDILAVDAGSLTSELSFSEQEKIKAILLSHGHYDHIRAVPAFAFNHSCNTTNVYATSFTLKILSSHLVDGIIYPKFTEKTPLCGETSLRFIELKSHKKIYIEGYQILSLPVNHTIETVGFEITARDGTNIFYSGDTGAGLTDVWENISSKNLIVDVTFPNKLESTAKNSLHLCPSLLKQELLEFKRIKGYLPHVIVTHMTPKFRKEIKDEIKEIAEDLNLTYTIAREGKEINI